MNDVTATVVLPACNEAASLREVITGIREGHPDFEILVVDDGSTDATAAVAREAGAGILSHPYNIGNGAAVKTGLRRATGEWVILMDADGQHDPADIARLWEHRERYDMVVGARSRDSRTSAHRDLANWLYNRLASYVTRFRVEDLTSGFRLVKRDAAQRYLYLLPNTFSYPSTLTMAYLRSGRSIKYVPVKTAARKGRSKIKPVRDGVRFLFIIMKIATFFSPMRVFLPVSLGFFLIGFFYYLYTFITKHRFTNMSALLLSTAVIIFMLGLVSEQISQMRHDRADSE
jgi:glycosyltransferase involved in cell wall biosynthesis